MARAHGNLCRELFASHLILKNKLIINPNCNVEQINTFTSNSVCIDNNLIVKGNIDLGNLLVPNLNGNLVSDKITVNSICELQTDQGIDVISNIFFKDDLVICDSAKVDLITEKTIGEGVCIQETGQISILSTAMLGGLQTVNGDAIWQSFELKETITLSIINVEMGRTSGFIDSAMEAKIFQGIGVENIQQIGSIVLNSYNGGDIDFSNLNLILFPGLYTLQMDYPESIPTNPINYSWIGHTRIEGEPIGSVSNVTLHLTVFFNGGGIKVTPFQTCVQNLLKLEFPDSNCQVVFVDTDPTVGEGQFGNGFLQFSITCNGNSEFKSISFDGDFTELKQGLFGNLCVNELFTVGTIFTKTADYLTICSNIVLDGDLTTEQICINDLYETSYIQAKDDLLTFKSNSLIEVGCANIVSNVLEFDSRCININGNLNLIENVLIYGNDSGGNVNGNINTKLLIDNDLTIDGNISILDNFVNFLGNIIISNELCLTGCLLANTIVEKVPGNGVEFCGNVALKNLLIPMCITNLNVLKLLLNRAIFKPWGVPSNPIGFTPIDWVQCDVKYDPLSMFAGNANLVARKTGVYELKAVINWHKCTFNVLQRRGFENDDSFVFVTSIQLSSDNGNNWKECARDTFYLNPFNPTFRNTLNPFRMKDWFNLNFPANDESTFKRTVPQTLCCECILNENDLIRLVTFNATSEEDPGFPCNDFADPPTICTNWPAPYIGIEDDTDFEHTYFTINYIHEIP